MTQSYSGALEISTSGSSTDKETACTQVGGPLWRCPHSRSETLEVIHTYMLFVRQATKTGWIGIDRGGRRPLLSIQQHPQGSSNRKRADMPYTNCSKSGGIQNYEYIQNQKTDTV